MHDTDEVKNFASLIIRHQNQLASKTALVISAGQESSPESVTFGEMIFRIERLARKLQLAGFKPGDRIVVGIPVSVSLYVLVLAVMAIGAIPVLINPGLGLKQAYSCLQTVKATGIISARPITRWRYLLPVMWRIRKVFTFRALQEFGQAAGEKSGPETEILKGAVPPPPEQPALITFTSGSSGIPKGVNRTHSVLISQYKALKEHFPPLPGQVDLPAFPVLTLYNLCCGLTTIMPEVNFKAVSEVNPALILQQIRRFKVNTLSGAPAYLNRITTYGLARNLTLSEIKGLAVGGAPVSSRLAWQIQQVFPEAEAHILYGSSEAEPVASVLIPEFLAAENQKHQGYLVGRPAGSVQLQIIPENSPPGIVPAQPLPAGAIGEIIVTGRHVCKNYYRNSRADQKHKLTDAKGAIWHRTGDVGFLDKAGQLWLAGRVENIFTLQGKPIYPFQVERVTEAVPGVGRAAVVSNAGQTHAVIFLENTELSAGLQKAIRKTLLEKFGLRNLIFKAIASIPVDKRHRSKADYPKLQKLAKDL